MSEKDTAIEKAVMIAGAAIALLGGASIVVDEIEKEKHRRIKTKPEQRNR